MRKKVRRNQAKKKKRNPIQPGSTGMMNTRMDIGKMCLMFCKIRKRPCHIMESKLLVAAPIGKDVTGSVKDMRDHFQHISVHTKGKWIEADAKDVDPDTSS